MNKSARRALAIAAVSFATGAIAAPTNYDGAYACRVDAGVRMGLDDTGYGWETEQLPAESLSATVTVKDATTGDYRSVMFSYFQTKIKRGPDNIQECEPLTPATARGEVKCQTVFGEIWSVDLNRLVFTTTYPSPQAFVIKSGRCIRAD